MLRTSFCLFLSFFPSLQYFKHGFYMCNHPGPAYTYLLFTRAYSSLYIVQMRNKVLILFSLLCISNCNLEENEGRRISRENKASLWGLECLLGDPARHLRIEIRSLDFYIMSQTGAPMEFRLLHLISDVQQRYH